MCSLVPSRWHLTRSGAIIRVCRMNEFQGPSQRYTQYSRGMEVTEERRNFLKICNIHCPHCTGSSRSSPGLFGEKTRFGFLRNWEVFLLLCCFVTVHETCFGWLHTFSCTLSTFNSVSNRPQETQEASSPN